MEQNPNNVRHSFEMNFGAKKKSIGGQVVMGLIFVIVGGGLLLDTFNIVEFWPLLGTWWPSSLMIIALVKLATRSGSVFGNGMLFTVGALLQLGELDIIHGFWSAFWPIVLILIGISMLVDRKKNSQPFGMNNTTSGEGDGLPYEENRLEANAIFAGNDLRVTSRHFTGGEANAIFGGMEIDFRSAEIEGNMVVLKCSAIFGGVEIKVPPHWTVHVKGTPIFGGIDDKTNRFRDTNVLGPTLVLDATVIFGGIEIGS
ncbi:MAG: LiaF-related protein [Candidatus Kapabacteria bacterium]|nr:LiaF-related protein [Candidatus Kapabacteria bacterium]